MNIFESRSFCNRAWICFQYVFIFLTINFLPFNSYADSASLEEFNLLVEGCDNNPDFYKDFADFEAQLASEISALDKESQKRLIYKTDGLALLFNAFGIYLYTDEPQFVLPLQVCWTYHYEFIELNRSDIINTWYDCFSALYQEEIVLLKKYKECQVKSLYYRKE